MKKVILILAVAFSTILLTSCTDNSDELEQLNITESELNLIDKNEIENPRDRD